MALPPVSYLEHSAAVKKTKSAIASIESELELKKQEIDYLVSLGSVNPQMVLSQPKLPSWSETVNSQQFPCLTSSNECVNVQ
jgi:hypothetical protein